MLRLKHLLHGVSSVVLLRDTKEITYVNYYKHYLYYQLIYQKKHYKLYGFLLIQKLL